MSRSSTKPVASTRSSRTGAVSSSRSVWIGDITLLYTVCAGDALHHTDGVLIILDGQHLERPLAGLSVSEGQKKTSIPFSSKLKPVFLGRIFTSVMFSRRTTKEYLSV